MSDFETKREALAFHRSEMGKAREEARLAKEAARKAARALDEFGRSASGDRDARRLQELRQTLAEAEDAQRASEEALAGLTKDEGAVVKGFDRLSDPRRHLGELSASTPILLFPLRLETRFMDGTDGQKQLWIRFYPDACLIDTFEATLSDDEIANAQSFWAGIWRAGGDEALEREAWRQLVAAHGSGRAGWIVRTYAPVNPAMKPAAKAKASDILLVILSTEPLPAAATIYWEAAWKADGNPSALEAAFTTLEGAVGAAQARDIVERHRPYNFGDSPAPPETRASVSVSASVILFPPEGSIPSRRNSWSSPAKVDCLPDRFVVEAYSDDGPPLSTLGKMITAPLFASPDPNARPEQQLKPEDDRLVIPDAIAWMFDFDKAVEAGMAIRIDLTEEQARDGFRRLVVLGVRLADTAADGRTRLETLLEHHLGSRSGFEIIPQGTPTNNTEQSAAGYSFRDSSDGSFETFVKGKPQFELEQDRLRRCDGQWFADLVGVRADLMQSVPNAGSSDQTEARAMQTALWPGTLGYMMNTLMAPVFSSSAIAATQKFFTANVVARGAIPSIRIGRQPYGILPVTAFGRMDWFDNERSGFHKRLHGLLRRIEGDWDAQLSKIGHVGKVGADPHQTLLDVLALHSGSVEYYPLQADSVEHKYNELLLLDPAVAAALLGLVQPATPLGLLRDLGYEGEEIPQILDFLYHRRQTPLDGPVVDDVPLSEREPLRVCAGSRNYIQWLIDAASDGIETLQSERGFDPNAKPEALLYLLLRHALQLSFHRAGIRLRQEAGILEGAELVREPVTVDVRVAEGPSESRYDALFKPATAITQVDGLRLGDYIAKNRLVAGPELAGQLDALELLSSIPTARLERVFAEHIDCCTYRLDAWKSGLCSMHLESLRTNDNENEPQGLALGCFGWIEPLRPSSRNLERARLPGDLAAPIDKGETRPLMHDESNGGLIHTPSLNHAATAAVLRNGYLANDGRLKVNLSARRVRLALDILEGLRNGQSLGALLGYQFERHVHDRGPLQVRDLVYPLRREFPLAANGIAGTDTETGEAKESIAAMNVVDGRKMILRLEATDPQEFTYPFGIASLPRRPGDQEQAITDAFAHIRDINDAVADLILAEGVHQAVVGNYDRSAGTFDAFAKGNYPPEPEVVRTPRTGIGLTMRTAIHLATDPVANPLPGIELTPLAQAEAQINAWAKERLPDPAAVGCEVRFTDRATDSVTKVFISQKELGLHPIDLLYRFHAGSDEAFGALDEAIIRFVQKNRAPRHDREIRILHTERVDGKVSWFALEALLRSLRVLVTGSRPLQPADLMRTNDAASDQQAMVFLPKERIDVPLGKLRSVLVPDLDALAGLLAGGAATIDDALVQYADVCGRLAAFRLPGTGTSFAFEWRSLTYRALASTVGELVARWDRRLERYAALIAEVEALGPAGDADQRNEILKRAELEVATSVIDPPLTDPDAYRAALDLEKGTFLAKRNTLDQLRNEPHATLTAFLTAAKAELPLDAFDASPPDFSAIELEIARFRKQLEDAVAALKDDIEQRGTAIDKLLADHDATTDGQARVKALQDAAATLFGEDFVLVPLVRLPEKAADELANAWQHSNSGALTAHLLSKGRDFPVDDWLHGVARVREPMGHWENAVLLSDAFAAKPPSITPLQLPFVAGDPWLALDIPEGHEVTSDRLLYMADLTGPFDPSSGIRGLLVDEWTEVIPNDRETTGIAFHYDRPNSEPPQSWLLALPATKAGWSWGELVETVNGVLDDAKRRSLEPVHVDATPYSAFLPATASAYTFPEISISNNWLRNLAIYDLDQEIG